MHKKNIVSLFHCFIVGILVAVQTLSFPLQVFAQTATSEATTEEATQSGSINFTNLPPIILPPSTPSGSIIPVIPTLTPNQSTLPSANLQGITKIVGLVRHDFSRSEPVMVQIENAQQSQVGVEVEDAQGNSVSTVSITKTTDQDVTTVQVAPPLTFRPGTYHLLITQPDGSVSTQDFTWGVLAINTDKSIYLPGQTANLAMAVLDDNGNMVCNADVTLAIQDPTGKTTTLSTSDKTITVNPQCTLHNFTLVPDYEAHFQTSGVGKYTMNLSATISSGTHQISDAFYVQDSVPFDVTRTTATRIFPPKTYPVTFSITANQDFNGVVKEIVPAGFTISNGEVGQSFDNVKIISHTIADESKLLTPMASSEAVLGASASALMLPFKGYFPISLGFGQQLFDTAEKSFYAQFGLAGHDGVDFAMPIGTPLQAVDDGSVLFAGDGAYGTTIILHHSWGNSYYGHLSKLEVVVGQNVTKGQEIGLSGNSGEVTGPHLHFGMKLNNNDPQNGYYGKIDPLPFLGLEEPGNVDEDVKVITWNVNVKKGDQFSLSYQFLAPQVSPQFYTIGPLSFYETSSGTNPFSDDTAVSQLVFKEQRQWQIAADSVTSNYLNGSSTAIGTGATTLGTLNSTLSAGNNLLIGIVQINQSSFNATTINAGNLTLKDGSTVLTSNPYRLDWGSASNVTDRTYMTIDYETGASANPTYTVVGQATKTGTNAQVRLIAINNIPNIVFGKGTSTAMSASTDTTLNSQTISAAGDNVIVAVFNCNYTASSGASSINAGNAKITTSGGATTLSSNEYIVKMNSTAVAGNFFTQTFMLVARQAGASANATYEAHAAVTAASTNCEADMAVFNGLQSASMNTGSNNLTTSGTPGVIGTLSTSLPAGDNVLLSDVEFDSTSGSSNLTVPATGAQLQDSSGTSLASNTFVNTFALSGSATGDWTYGYVYLDSSAAANASYKLAGRASGSTVKENGNLVAVSLYTASSGGSTGPTPQQRMRQGKWFNNGVLQPYFTM